MRVAYFEMVGGASGNMILGALVDAGAELEVVERALRTIPVQGWRIERSRVVKRGIAATYLDVVVPGEDDHAEPHAHEAHAPHPPARTLADVLDVVERSGLTAGQTARARAIYTRLAQAEAAVHGTSVEHVHFHEVGQIDAIIDVAAACVALDLLGVERVSCSPYPLGTGSISMHHGRYPNPPPATAELMRGAPTVSTDVRGEMVTTTAAAIFASLVDRPGERPSMTYERIGYGAGRSDFSVPNVLRVAIGETVDRPQAGADLERDRVVVLEANIDDMSPQHFELAFERVFAAGALDAWCVPISMKKSRPGLLFGALARPEDADRCARTILRETTTLGVRRRLEERDVLPRRIEPRETPLGTVRVKAARVDGATRRSLEYEDVARIAREQGRPIGEVARELEGYLGE